MSDFSVFLNKREWVCD